MWNRARPIAVAVTTPRRQPALLAVWVTLHTLDALLTLYLLGLGGTEANPLLRALMGPLGAEAMLCIKLCAAWGLGLAFWRTERFSIMRLANYGMGAVVAYNTGVLVLMQWLAAGVA